MTELLISRSDFEQYRQLPSTLDFETLVPHILRVQRGWVRDALGPALYRYLHTNQDEQDAIDLISGTSYTFDGQEIDYFGIKGAIACYAYAVYIKQHDLRVTRAGNKVKKAKESETASFEMIASEADKAMQEAQEYMIAAIQFLQTNSADYPLYVGGYEPRGSVKIGAHSNADTYSENKYTAWQR